MRKSKSKELAWKNRHLRKRKKLLKKRERREMRLRMKKEVDNV